MFLPCHSRVYIVLVNINQTKMHFKTFLVIKTKTKIVAALVNQN